MSRLLLTVVFLGAALAAALFFLRPEWQRFRSLGQEAGELEEISREFDELTANRDRLLDLVNSISKDNLTRLELVLPQGPKSSQFLSALESLALENGVALRRIDLTSPEPAARAEVPARGGSSQPRPAANNQAAARGEAKGVQVLPFNLQISGSYVSFKKFLASVEQNLRLIDVEEITFSASGKAELLDFSIKAKTYYQ